MKQDVSNNRISSGVLVEAKFKSDSGLVMIKEAHFRKNEDLRATIVVQNEDGECATFFL